MKKRKGLIAIIVICALSLVATIALGVASLSTFFIGLEDGRFERAWYEFEERYHLSAYVDLRDSQTGGTDEIGLRLQSENGNDELNS